jgi:hypothetical protein
MGRPKITIELGQKFGKLTAVGPFTSRGGRYAVICQCECGGTTEVAVTNLRHGAVKSCGCVKINPKYSISPGMKFGRLTVLGHPVQRGTKRFVRCACECGNETDAQVYAMVDGRVVSCGCYREAAIGERSTTHGDARRGAVSPEYESWQGMKKRCESTDSPSYKHYGGRGIKVCERWQSFENFLADMGRKPSPAHSIDRYPNNDGNYEPGNCRWATDVEQTNNRRVTPFVTYDGRTQTIKQWADELGFKYWSLRNRLVNLGWPVEKAFTTPAVVGRNQFD